MHMRRIRGSGRADKGFWYRRIPRVSSPAPRFQQLSVEASKVAGHRTPGSPLSMSSPQSHSARFQPILSPRCKRWRDRNARGLGTVGAVTRFCAPREIRARGSVRSGGDSHEADLREFFCLAQIHRDTGILIGHGRRAPRSVDFFAPSTTCLSSTSPGRARARRHTIKLAAPCEALVFLIMLTLS